jgi:hypothetical protein
MDRISWTGTLLWAGTSKKRKMWVRRVDDSERKGDSKTKAIKDDVFASLEGKAACLELS